MQKVALYICARFSLQTGTVCNIVDKILPMNDSKCSKHKTPSIFLTLTQSVTNHIVRVTVTSASDVLWCNIILIAVCSMLPVILFMPRDFVLLSCRTFCDVACNLRLVEYVHAAVYAVKLYIICTYDIVECV